MELREMRCLVALADHGSFTRAAQHCWVTQQAFSKSIATLERRLGTVLVVRGGRGGRGASLTPPAVRLVEAARPLLAQADRLIDLATNSPVTPAGAELRIGLLLDGLGPRTPGVLAGFRAAMPQVRTAVRRLHPHEVVRALTTRDVDVALVHGPVRDERLETVALHTERRFAVVSAADPRADAPGLSADDLLTLRARERGAGIDHTWEGFFTLRQERGGEEPERYGAPAASLEELLWSISLDHLFLTVPEHLAQTYPAATFGVAYVPVLDVPGVDFTAAFRRGDDRPAVHRFVEIAAGASA